jgi:hypothetical protein
MTVAVVAAAAVVLASPAQALAVRTLVATVRADGSTTLSAGGKRTLTTLRHGRYVVVIHDHSRACGFRLYSAIGIFAPTRARFVGTTSRRVSLVPGTYWYSCGKRSRHSVSVT